jgi:hypothetical protein
MNLANHLKFVTRPQQTDDIVTRPENDSSSTDWTTVPLILKTGSLLSCVLYGLFNDSFTVTD